jgi:hypothetical protein
MKQPPTLIITILFFLLLLLSPTTYSQTPSPSTSSSSGSCTSNDFTLYKQSEFARLFVNLDYCGKKSLGQESKSRTCLRDRSSLSAACIDCQVALISCTVVNCPSECSDGGQSNPACVSCVETKGCNGAFRTCTGWSQFPVCSECQQTLAPTGAGGFVPGVDMGGSVGIVIAPIIAAVILFIVWKKRLCHDDDRTFATQTGVVQMSPQTSKKQMMGGNGSALGMPIQSSSSFSSPQQQQQGSFKTAMPPSSSMMAGKQANIDMFANYNPSMAGLSPTQQMTYGGGGGGGGGGGTVRQQQPPATSYQNPYGNSPYANTGYNNAAYNTQSTAGYPTFSPIQPPPPPQQNIMNDI